MECDTVTGTVQPGRSVPTGGRVQSDDFCKLCLFFPPQSKPLKFSPNVFFLCFFFLTAFSVAIQEKLETLACRQGRRVHDPSAPRAEERSSG